MMAGHQRMIQGYELARLLEGFPVSGHLPANCEVTGIGLDSRRIKPGDLFVALKGAKTSGTGFIDEAVRRGASAVVMDAAADAVTAGVPVCRIEDLKNSLGLLASRFYDHPSRHLRVTGITGTNGKSSISWFLSQALSADTTVPVGCIGTLGYGEFPKLEKTDNTTPDAVTLQSLLARFRDHQVRDVVMEVSSHALDQGRVNGLNFTTAVFTNLTRDHLDYHADMSAYAAAKRKLFLSANLANAVINIDDEFGRKLANEFATRLNLVTYGLASADLRPLVTGRLVKQTLNTLELDIDSPWGNGRFKAALSGTYNVYNLLAALSVLCLGGMPFEMTLRRLATVSGVPGRMEFFGSPSSPAVFVDYAHTPDALEKSLLSLREQCQGQLVCVFGCGGDRDPGKRPQMGRVAETCSDRVILTSDNPRSESPQGIIDAIRAGMTGTVPVEEEIDRAIAIRRAITGSGRQDIVLIAGKGHETTQEIGAVKLPFSDRQWVRNILDGQT